MEDNKKKGLGMVLEGGGMRGLYTAGVLDELMEQGIYADSTGEEDWENFIHFTPLDEVHYSTVGKIGRAHV